MRPNEICTRVVPLPSHRAALSLSVLGIIGIMVSPFLFFYWLCPFCDSLSLGNDYVSFPTQFQLELMYSIRNGVFPLFVPSVSHGVPSAALSEAQIFHPISWLSSITPGYWDGNAIQINTFFRLIELGITHAFLYSVAKKFGLRSAIAFILSFITIYNLRMLDCFRYGAALENYTGFLCLNGSILLYALSPSRRLYSYLIIFFSYLTICGGHPQYCYIAILGTLINIPLVIPFLRANRLHPNYSFKSQRNLCLQIFGLILVGVALSAIYWVPFVFDFILENTSRVGQNYQWSLYDQSITEPLNIMKSWFSPLESDVHGNFGGSSLIILALLSPISMFWTKKANWAILFLTAELLFVLAIMSGDHTFVHWLLWKYVPLFSAFRVPGRFSFLIPWLLFLLLVWFLKSNSELNVKCPGLKGFPVLSILAALALFSLVAFRILAPVSTASYTPVAMNDLPSYFPKLDFAMGAITLISIILLPLWNRWHRMLCTIMLILVVGHSMFLLRYGTWVTEQKFTKTYEQIKAEKTKSINSQIAWPDSLDVRPVSLHNTIGPWPSDLVRITTDYRFVNDESIALTLTKERGTAQDPVYVQQKNEIADSLNHKPSKVTSIANSQPHLLYASFNEVQFHVSPEQQVLFVLHYPYSANWHAYIDGTEVKTFISDAAYVSAFVPPGNHTIRFVFTSIAFRIALYISGATLVVLIVFGSYKRMSFKIPLVSV